MIWVQKHTQPLLFMLNKTHQTDEWLDHQGQKREVLKDKNSHQIALRPGMCVFHSADCFKHNMDSHLYINQDCTAKCPKGICSRWPSENLWEQHTCGNVRECSKTTWKKMMILFLNYTKLFWLIYNTTLIA